MLSAARGRVYLAENTAPDGGHLLYENFISDDGSIGPGDARVVVRLTWRRTLRRAGAGPAWGC